MFKKEALNMALQLWEKGGFTVRFWDGTEKSYGSTPPRFKVIFNKEPNFSPSDLKEDLDVLIGSAYVDGIVDFEGNLDDIVATAFEKDPVELPYHLGSLRQKLIKEEEKREKANIHAHYDLGNELFDIFLDPTKTYSCAYFKHENDSLYEAQMNKIDLSLRKLFLKPGEKLLDIGCGWGELIIYAAKKYNVHAYGITLSEEQYKTAKERIHKEGLDGRCDVILENYLDLDSDDYRFDKIVSIGMFEHVGKNYLPLYFNKVSHLLKPGGLFLLHSILNMDPQEKQTKNWMTKYIFPGGYVPGIRETVSLFPLFGLRMIGFESLRRHYAKTLHCWAEAFNAHKDSLPDKYDDKFKRLWDIYLRGCESGFRTGVLDVGQFILSKGVNNDLPMTMESIYSDK